MWWLLLRRSHWTLRRTTMGCGPSNIINPRKWRSRAGRDNANHSGSEAGSDDDAEEAAGGASPGRRGVDVVGDLEADGERCGLLADGDAASAASGTADDDLARVASARLRELAQSAPGPLLNHTYVPHIDVSASQLDFFRLLDMKIENGPDLDSDEELHREETRRRGLLREWERCSRRTVTTTSMTPSKMTPSNGSLATTTATSAGTTHPFDTHRTEEGALLAGRLRHQHHSAAPHAAPNDATWRRANLAWVPEQRPVGPAQTYPGRPVAWCHNSHPGYATDSQWFSGPSQGSLAGGLGSQGSFGSLGLGLGPQGGHALGHPPQGQQGQQGQQVGFRPYSGRQQLPDDDKSGSAMVMGGSPALRRAYPGNQLGGQWADRLGGQLGGQWADRPADEETLMYSGAYYQQQQQHAAARYAGYGHVRHADHAEHADQPQQHMAMANSMVQLDKAGGTRTELA